MDQSTADRFIGVLRQPLMAAAGALGVLTLLLIVMVVSELKELRYIGAGISAANTISVSGEGEVFAVPDLATFSVTIQEEAAEVQDAQEVATEKTNAIVAYLRGQGIEERDIKTTSYNVYPQYDYIQSACREGFCPPGRQELRGYEVSQTIEVKVRDTDQAGEILSGVGSRGASNVSGLSFTIDDEDELRRQARELAIEDAGEKAAELAEQLNVRLVRIVSFNENEGGYPPMPLYARGAVMDMAMAESAPAPELPVGENKIVSNVSVTYEIR